jgi:hypothetical protein
MKVEPFLMLSEDAFQLLEHPWNRLDRLRDDGHLGMDAERPWHNGSRNRDEQHPQFCFGTHPFPPEIISQSTIPATGASLPFAT